MLKIDQLVQKMIQEIFIKKGNRKIKFWLKYFVGTHIIRANMKMKPFFAKMVNLTQSSIILRILLWSEFNHQQEQIRRPLKFKPNRGFEYYLSKHNTKRHFLLHKNSLTYSNFYCLNFFWNFEKKFLPIIFIKAIHAIHHFFNFVKKKDFLGLWIGLDQPIIYYVIIFEISSI